MPISARNHSDQSVDWWFAYKLPSGAQHPPKAHDGAPPASGYEYLYFDPKPRKETNTPKPLTLSHFRLNQSGGCFFNTVSQLFSERPQIGRIMYDDEVSGLGQDGHRGHCKGVLGFDLESDSAFWMIHSTPRYPGAWIPDYPEFEVIYGQTYLCITLPDVRTAEEIAGVMTRQHEPWVYGVRLPHDLPANSPLRALGAEYYTNKAGPFTEILNFKSKHGQPFRLMAKNAKWGKDFWNELAIDALDCNLNVETWRRGTLAATVDDAGCHSVGDAQSINLEPINVHYAWPYTQDHAKWAVSLKASTPWVCVGDINRDKSQSRRGGGAVAFQEASLWDSLTKIESLTPMAQEKRKSSRKRSSKAAARSRTTKTRKSRSR